MYPGAATQFAKRFSMLLYVYLMHHGETEASAKKGSRISYRLPIATSQVQDFDQKKHLCVIIVRMTVHSKNDLPY